MGSFVRAARFKSVIEMVKTALVVLVLFAGSISAKSECSNMCENGGWCGERRKNTTTGAVQRCADRTRYGKSCASTCGKGDNDYHWCWVGWHLEKDWEYCSPPGEVWDTAYTVNGQDFGECGTQGEKYWWCYKSPKFVTHNGKTPVRDADWDYCSPNPQNTRYNEPCSDACESRGETYYWCNTGSTWDYCSPAVETVEKVIGDGGGRCVGKCDALNEDYMWCPVINVKREGLSTSSSKVWWDYC